MRRAVSRRAVIISPEEKTPAEVEKKAGDRKQPDWLQRLIRLKPGPLRRLLIIVIVLALFFGLGGVISRIWTSFLWYQEMGHTTVFWTPFLAKLLVGLFFAVVFFILFYGSLWLARKISPKLLAVGREQEDNVFEWATRRKWPGILMLAISIIIAIIIGAIYTSRWQTILLFLHRTDFGSSDPIFHKDPSFFVFTLPVWSILVNFVGIAMLFTFIATAFTYVVDRAMVLNQRGRVSLAPHVKAHLSVILAIAMVAKAGDYMLQRWELDYSTRGVIFGASYTDVHALLPVLTFLAIVALIAAAIFLINIRYKGWRLPALALALMFLTWALAGKAYPAIIQQYRVSPNEFSAEQQYIGYNIETTRRSFGLDQITAVNSLASTDLTPADVNASSATTSNVRLWEPRPALDTYEQIQGIRTYYRFSDVDVDRYTVNGQLREVLISGRELDQTKLNQKAQTWPNLHYMYTHGYGFVMSPVNVSAASGLPDLFVSNIPPTTGTGLKITRPEIYYGELGNDFVIVKTKIAEFDYPKGEQGDAYATYGGTGGVPINSAIRKLAFAFRFNQLKLLTTNALTADSRLMFRRTIGERVHSLAPFLTLDKDPYLVLRDDGSLVWMWDAYLKTSRFPYSEPLGDGTNYIRNSIKVVIDAYNGGVTFYQVDAGDPLANAWGKVFEGLFTPGEQMPADLQRHMRYPEDLYTLQASVLATYHMTDPQVFYNKEDQWEIPKEIYGQGAQAAGQQVAVVPYYEVLALPGESNPEFALLQPFAPYTKQNLVALLAARQDQPNYGKLISVAFPKNKLVYGPAQMEARISNDPDISAALTLWSQAGSQVIRGNLLVVPIKQSVMYFEPIYLQASQSPIPELTRVIAAYGDTIVMEPTLGDALVKIFGSSVTPGGTSTTQPPSTSTTQPPSTTTTTVPPTSTTTTTVPPSSTTTTTPGTPTTLPTDVASLIALANQHYQAALAAQKAGDWAEYGRQISELGKVLEALQALQK